MEIFPQLQLILNKIFFVNFLVHIHAHYEYHRYALHDDSNAYPNHCSSKCGQFDVPPQVCRIYIIILDIIVFVIDVKLFKFNIFKKYYNIS
jgi:hypothetical protein